MTVDLRQINRLFAVHIDEWRELRSVQSMFLTGSDRNQSQLAVDDGLGAFRGLALALLFSRVRALTALGRDRMVALALSALNP